MPRRPAARAGAEAIVAETGPAPRLSEPPPTGLGFLVNEVSRLMRRRFVREAQAAELPLSPMEASALLTIARQQGERQARLAHLLDVEPITLAQLLARLEAAKLLERRPHPTDRRIRTVWLSAEGEAMVVRVVAVNLGVRGAALAGFSDEVQQHLFDALARIRGNLLAEPAPRRAG